MGKKWDFKEIKKLIAQTEYTLIDKEYKNSWTKMKFICPIHGEFKQHWDRFNNQKMRCQKCGNARHGVRDRMPIERVKQIIKEKTNMIIPEDFVYHNTKEKIKLICPKHGVVFTTLDGIIGGYSKGCFKCGIEKGHKITAYSIDYVKNWITHNTPYQPCFDEYINCDKKLLLNCPKHGHFLSIFNFLKNRGDSCPKCAIEEGANNRRWSDQEINQWLKDNNKTFSLKINTYTRAKEYSTFICPEHGEFRGTFGSIISQNQGCPVCEEGGSAIQREIYNYIGLFAKNITYNDHTIITPFELDIYHPETKNAFELDGLFWHSDYYNKNKKNTIHNTRKSGLCRKKGIKLFVIYEDEWRDKQDLVKAMIRYRLGNFPKTKFRASKLEIKFLNKNDDFIGFFDKFHLNGHIQANFAVGLFYNNLLISCMSFKENIDDKYWEIVQFASDYDFYIYGAASRLLKHCGIKGNLIAYTDNRIGNGDFLKKLGFNRLGCTKKTNYYYTDFCHKILKDKIEIIVDSDTLLKYPTKDDQALGGIFSQEYFGHNKPLYKIYDYAQIKWELFI